MFSRNPIFFLLAAASAAAGCFSGTKGVSPSRNEIHFPTAAKVTPGGKYLLVANSNFDLAWERGTLLMVDLEVVEAFVGCTEENCGSLENNEEFVLDEETVLIGSYASNISLSPGGGRIYLTVRGNNSLTTVNLDEEGRAGEKLSCFDSGASSRQCDSSHEVSRGEEVDLPADPYSLNTEMDGWVFVSHLTSSNVSIFKVDPEVDLGRDIPPALLYVNSSFPESVSSIVRHPFLDLFYATSRHSSSVVTFIFRWDEVDYENEPRIYFGPSVVISGLQGGQDARDIAFSPDGTMAFVTVRSPNSIVLVETAPGRSGWPSNKVVGFVPLDQGPSMVDVWQPEGSEKFYVYATCYNADRIYVIDPFQRTKLDTIATGDGPHGLLTDPGRSLGFILNFIESTISVVDLDPESPYFNRIRATLGKPSHLRRND